MARGAQPPDFLAAAGGHLIRCQRAVLPVGCHSAARSGRSERNVFAPAISLIYCSCHCPLSQVNRSDRGDRLIERIIEYRPSDTVLVRLLQALRPEKYGEKLALTQTTLVKTLDQAAWDAV